MNDLLGPTSRRLAVLVHSSNAEDFSGFTVFGPERLLGKQTNCLPASSGTPDDVTEVL